MSASGRGISLIHWGMFSTLGDIMMHVGGYHEFFWKCEACFTENDITYDKPQFPNSKN